MYRIEKKFSFPMGHRLSKHEGHCKYIHGHNFTVKVGLKSLSLNKDDMIIDFSKFKSVVKNVLSDFDHALALNTTDFDSISSQKCKLIYFEADPTAEMMAKVLFDRINASMWDLRARARNDDLQLDYVTVYENEDSKATYSIS